MNMAPYRGTVSPSTVTWHDQTRYHNDGTLTDVTWSRLPSGLWVAGFNGSTSFINVADNAVLSNMAALTLVAWVYPTGWGESDAGRVVSLSGAYQVAMLSGKFAASFYCDSADTTVNAAASSVALNQWRFIGATSTGTAQQAYVNGVASGAAGAVATGDIKVFSANLAIGDLLAGGRAFAGRIALIRIFPVAWSAADWSRAFSSERRLFGV